MIFRCTLLVGRCTTPIPAIALTGSDSPDEDPAWVFQVPACRVVPIDTLILVPYTTPAVEIHNLMVGGYTVTYDPTTLPKEL